MIEAEIKMAMQTRLTEADVNLRHILDLVGLSVILVSA